MVNTSQRDIAVVGLGAMGLPMATRLACRFSVTACDISSDQRAKASQAGVQAAASPAAAVANVPIALLSVRTADQVDAALFGPDGLVEANQPPHTVILTSTVGPKAAARIGGELHRRGIELIDAPISGGPTRAGSGELLIMAAAQPEVLERAEPLLSHLGKTVTVVGTRAGDGQAAKAINQLLAGVHIAAAAEAVALAHSLGLDPTAIIEALQDGAAASFMLGDRGPRMIQALTDQTEVRSRLDIFTKDLGIVLDIGRELAVALPTTAAAHQLYLVGESQGLAQRDDSSIVTILSPAEAKRETP
ncbi:NAD(P)-dependent oxidoreductase [Mycolicibacterium sp. 624]|uniref:NAD(P)-dependent oxidoreductase n=1 Tax=Mycolicibacterium sp. 624 TaxID=3156314 RepID=UPI0033923D56